MPLNAPFGEISDQGAGEVGFTVERIAGSHHILKHPDGRFLTVPVHRNQDLQRGIYRKILKDAELTDEELRKLL
ncbi:MAG TPA: type II toxin-antitoxin system HicA family toxin [Streptosporangiaceae bacterium]|jgi:predicted RNA binding protein YcfA (HicA-like mRNA interferase family)|nr:type II toxin-antitoxin system HicA family toxin [Streptosporangiaceae bacterium]